MTDSTLALPVLVCHPCPHGSACCRDGVQITAEEKDALVAVAGPDAVEWNTRWSAGEWHTTTRAGTCFFMLNNECVIHDLPCYPARCRRFPNDDGNGGPYTRDRTRCPEFATC